MIDFSKLQGHIPDKVLQELPSVIPNGQCTPEQYKNRAIHFISQCSHESQNFTRTTENLNYSYQGLLNTFPKYFTPILAQECEHQPEKIANIVYKDRMENSEPGDGWRFRGRGYIQITGRENYENFYQSLFINRPPFSEFPDTVATDYPLKSAAWFFDKNGIWDICDKGSTDDVIKQVSKRINGGVTGLDERIKLFRKYEQIIGNI